MNGVILVYGTALCVRDEEEGHYHPGIMITVRHSLVLKFFAIYISDILLSLGVSKADRSVSEEVPFIRHGIH